MAEPRLIFAAAVLALLFGCAAREARAPSMVPYPCCAEYDIDVNRVLGPEAIYCGSISDGADTGARRRGMRLVVACTRSAQSAGQTYFLVRRHSDGLSYDHEVMIFTGGGEKLLVQTHQDCEGLAYAVGACPDMRITDDGFLESGDCRWNEESLLSRLKPTTQSRSER